MTDKKTILMVHAMAELLAKEAEEQRREPATFDTTPFPPDEVIDYGPAAGMIGTALHHLDEALPGGQKVRSEKAVLLATFGLQALAIWLRKKGCAAPALASASEDPAIQKELTAANARIQEIEAALEQAHERIQEYDAVIDARDARIDKLESLSVTNILLEVAPGEDGLGVETYAESVEDVEKLYNKQYERIEELEDGLKQAHEQLASKHYHGTFSFTMTDAEGKVAVTGARGSGDPHETYRVMSAALDLTAASERETIISDEIFSKKVRGFNITPPLAEGAGARVGRIQKQAALLSAPWPFEKVDSTPPPDLSRQMRAVDDGPFYDDAPRPLPEFARPVEDSPEFQRKADELVPWALPNDFNEAGRAE